MPSIDSIRRRDSLRANDIREILAQKAIFIAVICIIVEAACALAHAPERTKANMAESILDATEEQLKSAQAKITYLGEQLKPIPTVLFFAEGHEVSMSPFLDAQKAHEPYTNDEMPYTKRFSVAPAEFRRMLSVIKPIVTAADAAKGPEFISFTVVRKTQAGFEGHEFRIGPASGEEFYRKLIDALKPGNEAGRSALSKQFANIYP
jgi:hypothetical protein